MIIFKYPQCTIVFICSVSVETGQNYLTRLGGTETRGQYISVGFVRLMRLVNYRFGQLWREKIGGLWFDHGIAMLVLVSRRINPLLAGQRMVFSIYGSFVKNGHCGHHLLRWFLKSGKARQGLKTSSIHGVSRGYKALRIVMVATCISWILFGCWNSIASTGLLSEMQQYFLHELLQILTLSQSNASHMQKRIIWRRFLAPLMKKGEENVQLSWYLSPDWSNKIAEKIILGRWNQLWKGVWIWRPLEIKKSHFVLEVNPVVSDRQHSFRTKAKMGRVYVLNTIRFPRRILGSREVLLCLAHWSAGSTTLGPLCFEMFQRTIQIRNLHADPTRITWQR